MFVCVLTVNKKLFRSCVRFNHTDQLYSHHVALKNEICLKKSDNFRLIIKSRVIDCYFDKKNNNNLFPKNDISNWLMNEINLNDVIE